MDVAEAIETRIEVREYREEAVEENTKRSILDAGRLASSGRNLEHWRFVLVDDADDLERLADLSLTGSWVAGADFAVVVCTDPTYDFNEIDAGRALTYMQFAAWDAGVGSCVYTVDNPEFDAFLGVPEEYDVTAVLGFGYPPFDVDALAGEKDRRPLSEVAYRGRFGEPLSDNA